MRILCLLIIITTFNQLTFSQATDSVRIEEKVKIRKTVAEVVVTGQLSEKLAKDAIQKIRIINNKALNSGLFNNLADVLEKETNIRIYEDNILGSNISLQGISGQNVKILIDDIPVIGRLNGNIDLSQITLNNIERIEIVEGPLSTIYGTDALAGTINIISKKTADYKKSINTYYESIGKYNYDVILKMQNKNQLASYNFGRNYFNGWSENQEFRLIPQSEKADTNRNKQWKPKEQLSHKLTYNIKKEHININNYIENFYEKITNLGKPKEPYFENAFDEYYYTYRKNIGSDINIKNEKDQIRILLAYNQYMRVKETFYTDLTNLSRVLVQDPSAQDTSKFNLLLTKILITNNNAKKLKYQTGIDFQYQSANGKRILNTYQTQSDYAFFSTIEYEAKNNLYVRPSARLIYNTKYNAPFIPALNILYDLNNYKVRFSYAKGFRAPDFKELFLDFVDINHNISGNTLLLAETSNNYHVSTTIDKHILNTKINTTINFFHNTINNKIDLTNTASSIEEYSYFNIDKYITKGISSNTKLSFKNSEINLGGSYIGRYNNLYSNYKLPEFSFSMDYNINIFFTLGKKMKVNMFYKNTGKVPTFIEEDNTIFESYSDPYNLLDFSISRRMLDDRLILTIGGKNLFNITNIKRYNTENVVHSSSNNIMSIGYGRSFFTRLNFRL